MTIYIVLDLEESPKYCVYSINRERRDALESEKELIQQSKGQRLTTIIEEELN